MSSSVGEQPASPHPSTAVASTHSPLSEHIGVLDVLRGIALLGMFVVHFYDNWLWVAETPGSGLI
jgi:uncharacterized membrane protein YeiB